mgnify:CR=1 FL=1
MTLPSVRTWKTAEKEPTPPHWDVQAVRMKMFDNLIGNIDRNAGNLLYNALRHTPEGGLIVVNAERERSSGPAIRPMADVADAAKVFVIGGGELYAAAVPSADEKLSECSALPVSDERTQCWADLDKMLMKVADNYDSDIDVMVSSLISILEPVMVVVLGVIVGFIVIALFMPMITLIQGMTSSGAPLCSPCTWIPRKSA